MNQCKSSVNIDTENGIENKSADLLLATEPSTSLNNEGDFFHHNDTPPESSPHPTRLELTTVEEAPAGPSEPENLIDQPAIRPQKRAARRQRQLMHSLIQKDYILECLASVIICSLANMCFY